MDGKRLVELHLVCVRVFCLCIPDCGDARSSAREYWTCWLIQWIGVGSSASGSLSLGGMPCCIVVVCIGGEVMHLQVEIVVPECGGKE